jgi:inner membrane protein involved in colicin E2 resistance
MWLWRLMWAGAVVGFAIVSMTFVLLLWFMIEVGFAWASVVLVVLAAWLLFSVIKNHRTGFDIRR